MKDHKGDHNAHAQRWRDQQYAERAKQFVNGCQGKKHYPSKRAALGVKNAMLGSSKSYDEWERIEIDLEPYKCRCCRRWHLGNKVKREEIL